MRFTQPQRPALAEALSAVTDTDADAWAELLADADWPEALTIGEDRASVRTVHARPSIENQQYYRHHPLIYRDAVSAVEVVTSKGLVPPDAAEFGGRRRWVVGPHRRRQHHGSTSDWCELMPEATITKGSLPSHLVLDERSDAQMRPWSCNCANWPVSVAGVVSWASLGRAQIEAAEAVAESIVPGSPPVWVSLQSAALSRHHRREARLNTSSEWEPSALFSRAAIVGAWPEALPERGPRAPRRPRSVAGRLGLYGDGQTQCRPGYDEEMFAFSASVWPAMRALGLMGLHVIEVSRPHEQEHGFVTIGLEETL